MTEKTDENYAGDVLDLDATTSSDHLQERLYRILNQNFFQISKVGTSFKSLEKTPSKSSPVCAIVGALAAIALIVGLCVGLWPCNDGFSGRGVGNCEDIDECSD